MHFLDVKTDYAFKKVFGNNQHQDLLKSFLNAFLVFPQGKKIEELTIQDPYNPPLLEGMKESFVDVKATLGTGEQVIIEMQVLNHEGFEKRVLYNACKNYSAQLVKGEQYHLINPVIALNIVDFIMFEDSSEVISEFQLLEKDRLSRYSDDIKLLFVELPKFKRELEELKELKEEWIYFVKNAEHLESIPDRLSPSVKKALEVVNEAAMTPNELEIQSKRKEFIAIQKGAISLGKKTGFQEGIEKGIEKGRQEGLKEGEQKGMEKGRQEGLKEGEQKGMEKGEHQKALDIAKKLLASGMDSNTICSITGLSQDQIQNL